MPKKSITQAEQERNKALDAASETIKTLSGFKRVIDASDLSVIIKGKSQDGKAVQSEVSVDNSFAETFFKEKARSMITEMKKLLTKYELELDEDETALVESFTVKKK